MNKDITSALHRLSTVTTWTAIAAALAFTGCNDDEPARLQSSPSMATAKASAKKRTTIKASGNEESRDAVLQSEPPTRGLVEPLSTELVQFTSAPIKAPARLDTSTQIAERDAGSALFTGVELPFSVKRLTVTTGVENREPNAVARIELGQSPIYAFVELSNPSDEAQEVVITFEDPEGPAVGHVTLSVPANQPRWRTWGRTRMVQTAGEWSAVVSTVDGHEIVRQKFAVEPSGSSLKSLTPQPKEQPSS